MSGAVAIKSQSPGGGKGINVQVLRDEKEVRGEREDVSVRRRNTNIRQTREATSHARGTRRLDDVSGTSVALHPRNYVNPRTYEASLSRSRGEGRSFRRESLEPPDRRSQFYGRRLTRRESRGSRARAELDGTEPIPPEKPAF